MIQAFSIDPQQDTSGIHPPHFCKVCYATMGNSVRAQDKGELYDTSLKPVIWTPHSDSSPCKVE
ncbi:MAG: hypothetical protein HRO68_09975 [Nitrosopumilus sp.]|nr:hypothetical protein [Nitrosopumilus sp.]